MKNIDEQVKKALMDQTSAANQMEPEIWSRLEDELFAEPKPADKKVKKMKKKIIPLFIAAAAGILIAFSFQTETGMALIDRIKEMFVPEKEVVQSIEGMEEETNVQLNEGKDAEYVIYIDEDRYKMIRGEGDKPDVITTKEELPEQYPEVSMTIEQIPGTAPDALASQYEEELKQEFPDLRPIEKVTEPVEGYQLHGIKNGGMEWDDEVVHAYVISNGKEGSFVITERYFLEAAEGHGARFYAMLQEFHIVD